MECIVLFLGLEVLEGSSRSARDLQREGVGKRTPHALLQEVFKECIPCGTPGRRLLKPS